MISPITPLTMSERITGIDPIKQPDAASPNEKTGGSSLFASVFQSAIQNVVETEKESSNAQYLLATGQLDNPAAAMIAMAKYQTATDMLVQMRNRAMDAYSELTRMSV